MWEKARKLPSGASVWDPVAGIHTEGSPSGSPLLKGGWGAALSGETPTGHRHRATRHRATRHRAGLLPVTSLKPAFSSKPGVSVQGPEAATAPRLPCSATQLEGPRCPGGPSDSPS